VDDALLEWGPQLREWLREIAAKDEWTDEDEDDLREWASEYLGYYDLDDFDEPDPERDMIPGLKEQVAPYKHDPSLPTLPHRPDGALHGIGFIYDHDHDDRVLVAVHYLRHDREVVAVAECKGRVTIYTRVPTAREYVNVCHDSWHVTECLAMLVGLWGHTPVVAYNGVAGLKAALDELPDCLLLDITMPGIDGYDLARRVRQAGLEKAKIVAVSAYSHPDHLRRVEEAGFDYRLTKPAEPAELEGLLKMIETIVRLAEQTENLAQRNVSLAERTEAIAQRNEAAAERTERLLDEVKEELKEVKEELKEVREDIREVKDKVDKDNEGEGWKKQAGE
jgi:two-component system OmpR family response regulator